MENQVLSEMEQEENLTLESEGPGPRSPIKIRQDLQEFFEVADPQQMTLKCKLAGQNHCKMDGVMGALKFSPQRGWYNFERHVNSAHKLFNVFGKRKRTNKKRDSAITCGSNELSGSGSGYEGTKWKSLSKEKYCIVCRDECRVQDDIFTDDYYEDQLKQIFPGCEGSSKLSHQLFFIFFVRNIIDFPSEKCEKFLRKCRGRRTPETWFFLCSTCRGIILEAASMHKQLVTLQRNFLKVQKLIKLKFRQDGGTVANYPQSSIEEEIRNHIICPNNDLLAGERNRKRTHAKLQPENLHVPSNSVKDDGSDLEIETNYDDVGTTATENKRYNTRVTGGRDKKNSTYIDYIYVERDKDDMENEKSPVVKVDPDTTSLYDDKDDDHVAYDSDHDDEMSISMSESDFEISNFSSRKKSSKSKRTLNKVNRKTTSKRTRKLKNQEHDEVASLDKRGSEDECNDNDKQETHLYVCQLCPSKYKVYGRLRAHLEAHEISKTQDYEHDCQQCGYPCHSEKTYAIHLHLKHGTDSGVPCTLCDYLAPSQRQLNIHLQQHREEAETGRIEGKYFCKLCNRLFISYDILCKHKRKEHYKELGVVPFRCEICSVIFSSKRHLLDHIQQTHKKQSRYFCEICGKGMMYMSKLKRHMTAHMKDRFFVCEICGADFPYSETMKDHVKKEHPEVGGAGDSTAYSSNVTAKHTCKHCSTAFASSSLLSRHIKSHTELYTNKCDLCSRTYATPQSLRRHVEINHTAKEIPCPYCDKKFPHQEYIRTHYKFCKKYPGAKKPKELDGQPLENIILDDHSQSYKENDNIMKATTSASVGYVNQTPGNIPELSDSNVAVVQHGELKLEEHHEYQDQGNQHVPSSHLLIPHTSGTVFISIPTTDVTQSVTTDSWDRLNDSR